VVTVCRFGSCRDAGDGARVGAAGRAGRRERRHGCGVSRARGMRRSPLWRTIPGAVRLTVSVSVVVRVTREKVLDRFAHELFVARRDALAGVTEFVGSFGWLVRYRGWSGACG
jgi:hypothetical protein